MVQTNVRIIAVKYYFRFRPVAFHITKNVRRITKVFQAFRITFSYIHKSNFKVMKLFANVIVQFLAKNVIKLTFKNG